MADIGGLKAAYYAYKKWRRNNPEEENPYDDENELNRMFWTAFATFYCNDNNDLHDLIHSINTDDHAPNLYRVIGTLKNLPEFTKDFNCQSHDYMYTDRTDSCDMW